MFGKVKLVVRSVLVLFCLLVAVKPFETITSDFEQPCSCKNVFSSQRFVLAVTTRPPGPEGAPRSPSRVRGRRAPEPQGPRGWAPLAMSLEPCAMNH